MFRCRSGCSECCGIIGFDPQLCEEVKAPNENLQLVISVSEHEGKLWFITTDKKCVFLDRKTNRCTIYDKRPTVCRDFGKAENLPCPYIAPSGRVRTSNETSRILGTYQQRVEKLCNTS